MGGSKKTTVGYRYFAGMHMVLCHGPIDNLSQIVVDEKELWAGVNTGGSVQGQSRGSITLVGNPTNIMWVAVGGTTFNFVNAAPVGNQVLIGGSNNETASNLAAKINALPSVKASVSGNVVTVYAVVSGAAGNAITLSSYAGEIGGLLGGIFGALFSIRLSGANLTGGGTAINKPDLFGGDSREGGISGNLDFLIGDAAQVPNDYLVSRLGSLVPAFRGVASVVLRQMYLSMNPYLKTWSFRVQRIHVQQDGLPQWEDLYSQINVDVYDEAGNVSSAAAMNPAHIIRECLTNRLWGMGYTEADINDEAFLAAAVTFYNERMGMSLLWDTQTSIEEFAKIILQHVDAALYVDRRTGKFTLKPIRGGYNEEDLLVLDASNIDKIEDFKRPAFGELANAITVNYWDYTKDQTASVTVSDIALAQEQGGDNATTVTYEGFIDAATASKVAQRDLRSLSTPLITCTIYATKVARNLNIGDVFVLKWPDYQIESVVMRVTGIAYGDGKTRRVRIQCAQDVFSYPEDAFVTKPPTGWVDPSGPPGPVTFQMGFEVPYYELVRDNGQSVVDSSIASNPYVGYVGAACSAPSVPAFNALMFTDDGSGYSEAGVTEFCAGAFLGEPLDYMQTSFELIAPQNLGLVEAGEWVQVGGELMGVVSIVGDVLTVKRGVLDTIPRPHIAGEQVLFWDGLSGIDPTEYVASDVVAVKLTAANGSGVYPIEASVPSTVEVVGRAAKPFAPGKLAFDGEYFPTDELSGSIVITWASRNRVLQTGGTLVGFVDDMLTPELGQTTSLRVYDKTGFLFLSVDDITGEGYTLTSGDYAGYDEFLRFEIFSRRDGLESFSKYDVIVPVRSGIDGGDLLFEMDTTGAAPAGGSIAFEMES